MIFMMKLYYIQTFLFLFGFRDGRTYYTLFIYLEIFLVTTFESKRDFCYNTLLQ